MTDEIGKRINDLMKTALELWTLYQEERAERDEPRTSEDGKVIYFPQNRQEKQA